MNQDQQLRLNLCQTLKSVEEAKKAYNFILEGKEVIPSADDNGIYLIYNNGTYEEFSGFNPRDNIESVGVVFQGHSFAVALRDLPEKYALVRDCNICEEDSPLYKGVIDAIFDWDAEEHTRYIVDAVTDIPLNEGEFIPTAAMLVAMYHMRVQLNKALKYAGGESMKTEHLYWSSSEYSWCESWSLNYGSGNLDDNNKHHTFFVRLCSKFNFLAF